MQACRNENLVGRETNCNRRTTSFSSHRQTARFRTQPITCLFRRRSLPSRKSLPDWGVRKYADVLNCVGVVSRKNPCNGHDSHIQQARTRQGMSWSRIEKCIAGRQVRYGKRTTQIVVSASVRLDPATTGTHGCQVSPLRMQQQNFLQQQPTPQPDA